jgi:hypothetical protein
MSKMRNEIEQTENYTNIININNNNHMQMKMMQMKMKMHQQQHMQTQMQKKKKKYEFQDVTILDRESEISPTIRLTFYQLIEMGSFLIHCWSEKNDEFGCSFYENGEVIRPSQDERLCNYEWVKKVKDGRMTRRDLEDMLDDLYLVVL